MRDVEMLMAKHLPRANREHHLTYFPALELASVETWINHSRLTSVPMG